MQKKRFNQRKITFLPSAHASPENVVPKSTPTMIFRSSSERLPNEDKLAILGRSAVISELVSIIVVKHGSKIEKY